MEKTIETIKQAGAALGAALVTYGVIDGETWSQVTGAVVVLVTFVYSLFTAKKSA